MNKNKITYTCELDGCNIEKTVWNSIYHNSKKHFCSNRCKGLAKERSGVKVTYTCELDGCDKVRTEWTSKYKQNRTHFCSLSCVAKAREIGKSRKRMYVPKYSPESRNVFRDKWNRMEWK